MLRVIKPGLQSTLQAAPRTGYRHFAIPYAGPADPLSLALANRLVGNPLDATGLEITFGGVEAEAELACSIAVTGAQGALRINGQAAPHHETLQLKPGDRIALAPPETGARTYLAIASGFEARTHFGSTSTYLPAGFGGLEGRALRTSDTLRAVGGPLFAEALQTPGDLRAVLTRAFALRACESSESHLLDESAQTALFETDFTVGRQATRMGLSLEGAEIIPRSDGRMASAPVFPGTVQCPPSGVPIVLLCDAQTTGGYPRIASIARCDRHLLGQIRPGDRVRLIRRSAEAALQDFKDKQALLDHWLRP